MFVLGVCSAYGFYDRAWNWEFGRDTEFFILGLFFGLAGIVFLCSGCIIYKLDKLTNEEEDTPSTEEPPLCGGVLPPQTPQ